MYRQACVSASNPAVQCTQWMSRIDQIQCRGPLYLYLLYGHVYIFFGTWWPVCTVLSRVEKYRVTIPLSRFFDQEKLSFLPEAHTCFNQLVLPDYRNKVREYVLYKCTLGSTSPCGDPQSISLDLPDWSILRSFRANSFSLQLTVGQDPSFDDVGSPDVQETGFVKYQLWKAQVC